jgi:hypothetical protein
VSRSARESAPRQHRDVLAGAGGLQLTISGLVAVVDSVGSCPWGVAELIDEAVFEPVVVGGAGIGLERVWEGALFDLASNSPKLSRVSAIWSVVPRLA